MEGRDSQREELRLSSPVFFCVMNARGVELGAGVNDAPVGRQSRAMTEPQREETLLASTKAESDELLLLDHRVRGKGEDLRTQKFCHLLMGVAFLISTLLTDSSEFD